MAEIQIKNLAFTEVRNPGPERFRKRLKRSERSQEKRKTTLISIYNIDKVENPLDFHPAIDITFVRT